jgi:hypothetical protein
MVWKVKSWAYPVLNNLNLTINELLSITYQRYFYFGCRWTPWTGILYRCGYCNLWNNWCHAVLVFWNVLSCLKIFNWAFIPIEFWKDRAILKPFWMFFVCFHPFSNKVKIVHLRAGCFLKLEIAVENYLFIFIITESNEPVKSIGISFSRYT